MIRVEVKMECFIGVENQYGTHYELSGWAGEEARYIGDLASQLERGGIDLGRDFTARFDHAAQVFIATQGEE